MVRAALGGATGRPAVSKFITYEDAKPHAWSSEAQVRMKMDEELVNLTSMSPPLLGGPPASDDPERRGHLYIRVNCLAEETIWPFTKSPTIRALLP